MVPLRNPAYSNCKQRNNSDYYLEFNRIRSVTQSESQLCQSEKIERAVGKIDSKRRRATQGGNYRGARGRGGGES